MAPVLSPPAQQQSPFVCCGVRIDPMGPAQAAAAVRDLAVARQAAAVHLCNANNLSVAMRDESYRELLNDSTYNFADGFPVAWAGRRAGHDAMDERVYGPTLMLDVMRLGVGSRPAPLPLRLHPRGRRGPRREPDRADPRAADRRRRVTAVRRRRPRAAAGARRAAARRRRPHRLGRHQLAAAGPLLPRGRPGARRAAARRRRRVRLPRRHQADGARPSCRTTAWNGPSASPPSRADSGVATSSATPSSSPVSRATRPPAPVRSSPPSAPATPPSAPPPATRRAKAMSSATPTVLVAGGGGFIGGHLVADLLRQGLAVRAVDRKPFAEWYQVHPDADNRIGDLSELARRARRVRGRRHGLQPRRRHGRHGVHRDQQGAVHAQRPDQHPPARRRARRRRRALLLRFLGLRLRRRQADLARRHGAGRGRRLPGPGRGRLRLGEAVLRAHGPALPGGLRAPDPHRALPQRLRPARHVAGRPREGTRSDLPQGGRRRAVRRPHRSRSGATGSRPAASCTSTTASEALR